MSDSAKIGRGKRSPSRARYKAELRDQRNKRLRAEKLKRCPQIAHPKRGLARAKRRLIAGISKESAQVLYHERL